MAAHKREILAKHVIEKLEGLEEAIQQSDEVQSPHGAFGVVHKVTVNGTPCVAKQLHQILVRGVSYEEKTTMIDKFLGECVLLSRLKHPNIVHFIGVYFGSCDRDLALVMERLHTDVAGFVQSHKEIPIAVKTSIMLDVSYGLLYLHTQPTPIVHRDLTAPNILLTSDLRAKIADLGVSKVLPSSQFLIHTAVPGNMTYMAPETRTQNPNYGTPVDIFSAGHLMIHISIQDWPKLYKVSDHHLVAPGEMELAERKEALNKMGVENPLYQVTVQCLLDSPIKRPSTEDFNKQLNKICRENPRSLQDLLTIFSDKLSNGVSQPSRGEEKAAALMEELTRERNELRSNMETYKLQAQTYHDDFNAERRDREKLSSRLSEVEASYVQQLQDLTNQIEAKDREIHNLMEGLKERNEELNQLRKIKRQPRVSEDRRHQDVPVPLPRATPFSPNSELRRSLTFPTDDDYAEVKDPLIPADSANISHDYAEVVDGQVIPAETANHHDYANLDNDGDQKPYVNIPPVITTTHEYENLRKRSEHAQNQYRAVAEEPENEVSGLLRNRTYSLSTPNISALVPALQRGKTLTPSSRRKEGRVSLDNTQPGENLQVQLEASASRSASNFAELCFDDFEPVPRERSRAVSQRPQRDVDSESSPPPPPPRHQSISRARSNPTARKLVTSSRIYEHVPKRYDLSLSLGMQGFEHYTNSITDVYPEASVLRRIKPSGEPGEDIIEVRRSRNVSEPSPIGLSSPPPEISGGKTLPNPRHHKVHFIAAGGSNELSQDPGDPFDVTDSNQFKSYAPKQGYVAESGFDLSQVRRSRAKTVSERNFNRGSSISEDFDPSVPIDPNLVCPNCNRSFREGEIQKYRKHYTRCKLELEDKD